ncbi:MAG: hypothetical protein AAB656_00390 [Patescibacteria group bacterium]
MTERKDKLTAKESNKILEHIDSTYSRRLDYKDPKNDALDLAQVFIDDDQEHLIHYPNDFLYREMAEPMIEAIKLARDNDNWDDLKTQFIYKAYFIMCARELEFGRGLIGMDERSFVPNGHIYFVPSILFLTASLPSQTSNNDTWDESSSQLNFEPTSTQK